MATKLFKIKDLNPNFFKGISGKENKDGNSWLISSGCVFPSRLREEKFRRFFSDTTQKQLKRGDVLFNTGGVGTLGRCGYFNLAEDRYFPDSFVLVLRFINQHIFSKYIFYALQSQPVKAKIIQGTIGTTGITSIKPKDILLLEIPIPVDKNGDPDLVEQKRVVAILEGAETLKKIRAEADQKMNELVPALFAQMFGDLSKWSNKRLGEDLAEFKYGTSVKCDYKMSGLPVLRIPNILGGKIDSQDLKYCNLGESEIEKLSLNRGDILFVRTNGNPDYVGRCAVFDLSEKYLFASYLIRARFDQKIINPSFLATFLRTNTGRNTMVPAIRTTAGQSNISVEGLKSIIIPMPPIDLQNQFAEKVKEIETQKEKQKQSTIQLDVLFSSLLSQVFP